MFSSLFPSLTLLFVLLLLSAFFAGAETVFFSLSRSQLADFKKSKNPLARQLVVFLSKPRDILVTILFGNELTNIAISILVASIFYEMFSHLDIKILTFLSVGVGTFLILVIGEIIPKSIGILFASPLAPLTAFLLKPLHTFLKPLRHILVKLADWFIHKTGGSAEARTPLILEEEFRYLLDLSAKSGELEEEERELIHKALDFKNKVVSQIMVPITKVLRLSVDTPYLELLTQIKVAPFSRIPVYEEKLDNIVGLLFVKDLFKFDRRWRENRELTVREILRPVLFVPPEEHLEDLLQKIRETRIHLAIVVASEGRERGRLHPALPVEGATQAPTIDAGKKPVGVVTLDDIMEELFGEFREEESL